VTVNKILALIWSF